MSGRSQFPWMDCGTHRTRGIAGTRYPLPALLHSLFISITSFSRIHGWRFSGLRCPADGPDWGVSCFYFVRGKTAGAAWRIQTPKIHMHGSPIWTSSIKNCNGASKTRGSNRQGISPCSRSKIIKIIAAIRRWPSYLMMPRRSLWPSPRFPSVPAVVSP